MIQTGTTLVGRYDILEQIGSGGMAYVYKARDKKLNRLVAIKVLKEEFCKDKSFVTKFRMEAQAAAGLSHNNIVGVYDVGEENNVYFIVMELIDGITLKEYITRKHKLGTKETIGIAIQVALGLDAAHNRHIVHRDIKPQNIIISRDGRIKVADFGIARAITDETTNLYGAAGSVHYISPEQARGGYCDERSDIYSLGITMYEMVTGRVPFDGDTTVAVAIAHINEAMVPPSNIEPSIPIALEQIIYKCSQKRPQQRYSSCEDLIKDLRHAIVAPNERFVHFIQMNEAVQQETVQAAKAQPESRKHVTAVSPDTIQLTPIGNISAVGRKEESANDYFQNPAKKSYSREAAASNVIKQAAPAGGHRVGGASASERRVSQKNGSAAHTEKKKESKESSSAGLYINESTVFDKVLVGVGSVLGIVILCMMVYIVGSFSGLFQRLAPVRTVTKDTPAVTTEDETLAPTYESIAGESLENDRTEVPFLLGLSIEEATEKLREYDLKINVSKVYEYSDEYGVGMICRQQYEEGTIVDKGISVKVYLSFGTDKFYVDSNRYIGNSLNILEYYLKGFEGITIERIEQFSDDYKKGIVMYLEPENGYLAKGETLKVYISKGPEYAQVPSVYGMSQAQAVAQLEKDGFVVGSINEVYSDVTAGLVCNQSVEAYSVQKSGTAVNIDISIGPKTVPVPWVTGLSEQDAEAAIAGANLYYSLEYTDSDEVAAGVVISQAPSGDNAVIEWSTVHLVISTGSSSVALDSGAVTNMSQEQAQNTIASTGLTWDIRYENSDSVQAGCATRWEPATGNYDLRKGDTVYIYISTGPAQTDPPAPPQTESPAPPQTDPAPPQTDPAQTDAVQPNAAQAVNLQEAAAPSADAQTAPEA